MCRLKVLHSLLVAAIVLGSFGIASAQSTGNAGARGGWGARAMFGNGAVASSRRVDDNDRPGGTPGDNGNGTTAGSAAAKSRGLTGSWR
ncbi:MAG: hypothetical protein WBQ66_19055, partial [Blastocatellia bacterium]